MERRAASRRPAFLYVAADITELVLQASRELTKEIEYIHRSTRRILVDHVSDGRVDAALAVVLTQWPR
jgi:hypothetical protein